MNKIDYENIKKELSYRDPEFFRRGGELDTEYIERESTEVLRGLLWKYENDEKSNSTAELKKLVDQMFQQYGEEDNNMIVLESVRSIDECLSDDDPMELYYCDSKENKCAHPVGMEWHSIEYCNVFEDYNSKIDNIKNHLQALNAPNAESIFSKDDVLDECWYGVTAITRNYEYVYFHMRNDGRLLNQNIYTERKF